MKKKILYGIIIFVVIVLLINTGVVVVSLLSKVGKKEEPVSKQEKRAIASISCTYTDADNVHYLIELSFSNNQLISRYDETSWSDKDVDTCTFYNKRAEVYSSISGIRDEVNCDNSSGIRRTFYTFSELDEKEANLSELKYIRADDHTFDIDSYKAYREKKGYACTLG